MTAIVEAARSEPIPKGPRPHLLAGNLPEWGRDPLAFLSATARDYGDVVPLRFGPTPGLLVNRADYVEAVLVTQGRSFRKPPAIRRLNAMIGNGLVASEGDFWLRQRRLAQPAFHRQRIADYGEVMVDRADRMLDGWAGGDVRDLHQEMKELTLEIVAKVLFDTEVAADVRTVAEATDTLFNHFQGRLNSLLFLLPDALPTPGNRRMWRAVRRLEALIARIVGERRASDQELAQNGGRDRADLLSMLLAARDADGARMTDRQLRDEVMTLLLAGHETTALTLTWCWNLLAQHPGAERRLHDELRDVVGADAPTAAHVPQLPHAEAIVNEALRLYPPAWIVGREAVQNVPLGPYCVRKGTTVVISPWLLHRDERYFDDPESFRPERWLDGLARQLPRGAFIPFGAGPRLCIGAGFAMTEAVLLLARIAQRYRLRLVPGPAIEPQTGITLRPGGSVRMRLETRATPARP